MTKIRETYSRTRAFYSDIEGARLLWEMLKMEIRAATIAYSKKKAKTTTKRELDITTQLEFWTTIFATTLTLPTSRAS